MTKIEESCEAAKKALENYRQDILEEFLRVAKELSKEMEMLCETGVDKERGLCFKEHKAECADYYYTIQNRELFTSAKEVLDSMKEENAIGLYREITTEAYAEMAIHFDQMWVLEELNDKYLNAEMAISEIN